MILLACTATPPEKIKKLMLEKIGIVQEIPSEVLQKFFRSPTV